MPDAANTFRWFQFGLKSLLTLTLIGAVIASFIAHRRQSDVIAKQTAQIEELNEEVEYTAEISHQCHALVDVFQSLNLENAKHRQLYEALCRVYDREIGLASYESRALGEFGATRVKVFRGFSPSGAQDYVAVIVHGTLVDFVDMHQCNGMQWQEQEDGALHIEFTESAWSMGGELTFPEPHVFAVTPEGFERIGGKPQFRGFLGRP